MKKPKIIGYVVISMGENSRGLYTVGTHEEEKKCLWFGNSATLFKTRKIAKRFIKRTRKYGDIHGFLWPWIDNSCVVAVRKQEAQ